MNTITPMQHLVARRPDRQSSPRVVAMRRYGKWLRQVEAHMHQVARGEHVELAGRMACQQLASGGKRLRARLALAACDALGVDKAHAIRWAAAVELLHNATLVHDDIQDGDTMRRGHPTLWTVHGAAQAINAGDLMLMLPYLALEDLPASMLADLVMVLASHAARIVRGQAREMALLEQGRVDMHAYRMAAEGKTGALMGLCAAGAAIMAGRGRRFADEVSAAFVELGVLFQLQDDVLDLFGDKGRGEVGCDLYEGKVSAVVVAHLLHWPQDRTALLDLLRTPREQVEPAQVERAIAMFRDKGALGTVLRQIRAIEDATHDSAVLQSESELHAVARQLADLATAPISHLLNNHTHPSAEVA